MTRSWDALKGISAAGWGPRIASDLPDARCCRLTSPLSAGAPQAGGPIDGVIALFIEDPRKVYFQAHRGRRVQVETAAAVTAGQMLRTDADGRVRFATGDDVRVLRALETAAGPGVLVWCVFV